MNIDLSQAVSGEIKYNIYNKQGQRVAGGVLNLNQPQSHLELNLNGVLRENDIYYLKLSGVDKVFKIMNK